MIAAGCMSGTSLDGIDVAVVELVPRARGYTIAPLAFETVPFADELRCEIVGALPPNAGSTRAVAHLHAALGDAFGDAVARVARDRTLDFIASHGLTLRHDPAQRVTLQLGDAFRIRERCGATVVYDFRSADTAAGGEGAPLVPYVDALVLADPAEDRVAINLGGIANLTVLRAAGDVNSTLAFDSGPGNMLVDAFVGARTGGRETMDAGGRYGLAGTADAALLAALRSDRYFGLRPPKSTGRERFGAAFFEPHRVAFDALTIEDGCATLAALTASTLADAVSAYAPPQARVVVSGGGAHNAAIVGALERALGRSTLRSDAFGIPVDAKEAIAFALLGYETLRGRAAGLPSVTGARHPAVLGAIAPCDVGALLARVDGETARAGNGT